MARLDGAGGPRWGSRGLTLQQSPRRKAGATGQHTVSLQTGTLFSCRPERCLLADRNTLFPCRPGHCFLADRNTVSAPTVQSGTLSPCRTEHGLHADQKTVFRSAHGDSVSVCTEIVFRSARKSCSGLFTKIVCSDCRLCKETVFRSVRKYVVFRPKVPVRDLG